MRAYEFINEVVSLDKSAPETNWYKTTDPDAYRNPTVHVGAWTDPSGQEVKTQFRKDVGGIGQTDIKFTRTLPIDHPDYHPAGTMGITGTGKKDAPKIFSGVVNNVKTFLDQHPDQKSVVFKSEQPSRTRLYSKMIDRLAPQMGMIGSKVDREGGAATFQLNRAGEGETHQPLSTPRAAPKTSTSTNVPAVKPVPVKPLSMSDIKGKIGGGRLDDYNDMASPDYSMGLDPSYPLQQMKQDQMNRLLKKNY
jgi:hypothetical protein